MSRYLTFALIFCGIQVVSEVGRHGYKEAFDFAVLCIVMFWLGYRHASKPTPTQGGSNAE